MKPDLPDIGEGGIDVDALDLRPVEGEPFQDVVGLVRSRVDRNASVVALALLGRHPLQVCHYHDAVGEPGVRRRDEATDVVGERRVVRRPL